MFATVALLDLILSLGKIKKIFFVTWIDYIIIYKRIKLWQGVKVEAVDHEKLRDATVDASVALVDIKSFNH